MEGTIDKPRVGLARKLARKLVKAAKISGPPVRINDIVTYLKGDRAVLVKPLSLDNLSAMVLVEDDTVGIAYNSKQHPHRQRFSVAHEIGHLLLEHPCNDAHANFESSKIPEQEANEFAAELLMPLDFLKKDVHGGGRDVAALAQRYWVSEEAMGWRIQCPEVLRLF